MKEKGKIFFRHYILFIIFFCCIFSNLKAIDPDLIQNKAANLDSLNELLVEETKNAISSLEYILANTDEITQQGEVELRLADLYLEMDRNKYFEEYALYDHGKINEPPVKDYSRSIKLYKKVLNELPDSKDADYSCYALGYCYLEQGENQEGISYLQKFVTDYKDSPYAAEVYLRIGKEYFEQNDIHSAIDAFKFVLTYWDSKFYDKAIYMLGWCYYKLSDYNEAIIYFTYLLDEYRWQSEEFAENSISASVDMTEEAKQYMAFSFLEHGGVKSLIGFLDSTDEENYVPEMIFKLGDIYLKQGEYEHAIETFREYIDKYPDNSNSFQAQQNIITCMDLMKNIQGSIDERERVAKEFGPLSTWFRMQNDSKALDQATLKTEDALYQAAIYYHQKAQNTGNPENYLYAINDYLMFVDMYTQSQKRMEAIYSLAQCYFDTGDYLNASKYYKKVIIEAKDNKLKLNSAYNNVVSCEKYKEHSAVSDTGATWIAVRACENFVDLFPEDEKVSEIYFKLGEHFIELDRYSDSQTAYAEVVNREGDSELGRKATKMLARVYFKQGNFKESEKWFDRAYDLENRFNPQGEVKEMRNLAAVSGYKHAELLEAGNDLIGAANELLRVGTDFQDSDVKEQALFDAGDLFLKAGDTLASIMTFEKFAHENQSSKFAAKALYNAAVLREIRKDYENAAGNFLTLDSSFAGSIEYSTDALFFAASNYEKASLREEAVNRFREYRDRISSDPAKRLIAALKVADIQKELNPFGNWVDEYLKVIETGEGLRKTHIDADPNIMAKAQFNLGEYSSDNFQKTRLTKPLKDSLERKKNFMRKGIDRYTLSAQEKVSDWVIASECRIGQFFESFYNELLGAELPAGLTPEEQDQYSIMLEETAKPFKDKAIEAYVSCLQQGNGFKVSKEFMPWITACREGLGKIAPEKLKEFNENVELKEAEDIVTEDATSREQTHEAASSVSNNEGEITLTAKNDKGSDSVLEMPSDKVYDSGSKVQKESFRFSMNRENSFLAAGLVGAIAGSVMLVNDSSSDAGKVVLGFGGAAVAASIVLKTIHKNSQ